MATPQSAKGLTIAGRNALLSVTDPEAYRAQRRAAMGHTPEEVKFLARLRGAMANAVRWGTPQMYRGKLRTYNQLKGLHDRYMAERDQTRRPPAPTDPPRLLYSLTHAAMQLDVSVNDLKRLMEEGTIAWLPGLAPTVNDRRIERAELERYVASLREQREAERVTPAAGSAVQAGSPAAP